MSETSDRPDEAADPSAGSGQALRRRAEEVASADEARNPEALSPETARRVLHELRVHQIELEMQNEELRRAQVELEASQARYFDLYDLAPVGYVTLGEQGLILEANLTAATLLGVARSALVSQPLSRHILPEDQDIYYRHRKQLFETGAPQVCELRMVRQDGAPSWARLNTTLVRDDESGLPVCRVVLSDITDRKRGEEALLRAERVRVLLETAGAAAHEINQPLTVILGMTQLLSTFEDSLSDGQKIDIEEIHQAGQKIRDIVSKMQSLHEYITKPYKEGINIVDLDAGSRKQAGE